MRYQPQTKSRGRNFASKSTVAKASARGKGRPPVSPLSSETGAHRSSSRSKGGYEQDHHRSQHSSSREESYASSNRGRPLLSAGSTKKTSQIRGELPESNTASGDNRPDPKLRLAWGRMKRREWQRCESSPAHEAVIRSAIPFLRATLVTGYRAGRCSPWADANEKGALSNLMKTIWVNLGCRTGREAGSKDEDVDVEPTEAEAKRVCSPCTAIEQAL